MLKTCESKICYFGSPTITNNIIMTSLLHTMAKFGPSPNQIKYIYSKGIDESYSFLLNLSLCVESYRHFYQIFAVFAMPAHQISSCYVTQDANFENFYFVLILHLILGKVTKFPSEKLSTSEVISKKPHRGVGWKTPPSVPLGLT